LDGITSGDANEKDHRQGIAGVFFVFAAVSIDGPAARGRAMDLKRRRFLREKAHPAESERNGCAEMKDSKKRNARR